MASKGGWKLSYFFWSEGSVQNPVPSKTVNRKDHVSQTVWWISVPELRKTIWLKFHVFHRSRVIRMSAFTRFTLDAPCCDMQALIHITTCWVSKNCRSKLWKHRMNSRPWDWTVEGEMLIVRLQLIYSWKLGLDNCCWIHPIQKRDMHRMFSSSRLSTKD